MESEASIMSDETEDADESELLYCEVCGEELWPEDHYLCVCGQVLCAACLVIGEDGDDDLCQSCADRLALTKAMRSDNYQDDEGVVS
jgi:hypothetical protein